MGSVFLCSLCRVETPDPEENASMNGVKAAQDAKKTVDFLTASISAGRGEGMREEPVVLCYSLERFAKKEV